MRLIIELAIIAVVVILAALVAKVVLANMEDDAFDAELTAISNERARRTSGMALQEMN